MFIVNDLPDLAKMLHQFANNEDAKIKNVNLRKIDDAFCQGAAGAYRYIASLIENGELKFKTPSEEVDDGRNG